MKNNKQDPKGEWAFINQELTAVINKQCTKLDDYYKIIISNAIILLREENTKYFNIEYLSNELGAPLKLIQEIDKELSEK